MNSSKFSDCRICFNKDDELTDLFAGVILGENIVTAIMECTSVEIQHNDRYSPMICASCLDKLHIALQFRMMCLESNKRLQNDAEQTSEDATENDDIEEMPVKVEIHTEDEDHLDNSSTTFIPETSSKTLVDLSSNTNDKEQFSKEVPNNSGHSASSLYKCESCGKILTNAKSMDRHVRTHLGDKRHECDICHRKFLFKYLVERHKAVKHSDKPTTARKPPAQSQEKTVECPFCSKKFFRNCQLKEHFRLHTGETPYMCDTCGKKFRTLDCLKKHTTVHTGFKKNYKCDICSKVFHTTRYLKRHIASIHEGLRPFECNVCRKRFRQQSYLDIHQLTHTGERPHRCDVCGRAFARSYTLTAHRRIHTGDRPHKCYVCGAAFAQRTPLRTHLKRHGVDDTENKLLATEFS